MSVPHTNAPRVPEALAVATLVLGGVYTAVEVLVFLTSFGAADAYGEAADLGIDALDVLTAYDAVSIGYFVLLPLWIVASLFLQGARARVEAVSPGFEHRRGRIWVWIGWFVPIVALWFPYQVVRDIVRNAWRDPRGDQRQGLGLGFWWAAWIVALLTGQAASRLTPWSGVPDADLVALLPLFHGITAVATVVGYVLWVRIVRSVLLALRTPSEQLVPRT